MSTVAAPAKGAEPVKGKAPPPAAAKASAPELAPGGAKRAGSPGGRTTPKEAAQAKPSARGTARGKEADAPASGAALSAGEQRRLASVVARAEENKAAATTHESAGEAALQARAAAAEPTSQAQGEALDAHAGVLEKNAPPDPEIVHNVAKIEKAIRDKRPHDEDQLGAANPQAMAQAAGQEFSDDVRSEVKGVEAGYGPVHDKPEGTPSKAVTPLPGEADAPAAPALDAREAAPDPLKPADVSLDGDKQDIAKDASKAQLGRPEMAEVKDGPIPEAIAAKTELEDFSIWGPNEALQSDKELRASASASMKTAEADALAQMKTARKAKLAAAEGDKESHKTGEEKARDDVGKELQKIYDDAEDSVRARLKPMVSTAMTVWDNGLKPLSTNFDRALKRVDKWIKDRQDSTLSSIRDFFAGLPNWIVKEYEQAEEAFAHGAGELALTLSSWVNGIISDCQKIIADAKKAMKAKIDNLEPSLKEYALGKQATLEARFEALTTEVTTSKRSFTKQLTQKLTSSVGEKRKKVAELREKSKGLWQRAKEAVAAFIDDPLKALIDGFLSLLGIPPAAFWAMVAKFQAVIEDIKDKPKVFANNLVAAIKKGFEQFKDNIGTHLIKGLLIWLTSKLKDAGVQAPTDLSLKSLLTLFLQLLGVSWPKIRTKLVKYIGEKNMKRIELAVQLVTTFMKEGWDGIYKLIKEKLDPQILVDAVLGAVKKFIIETIVKQAALRLIALFNPVGAIAQALELIYKAVTWILENAAKIFTFIEAIVNGAANIMAGAIGGAANLIEKALGMLVPIVIDLFAKILSLGGLPDKVKEVVGSLQEAVDAAMDKAIEWIASKVGLSKEEEKKDGGDIGESVPFTLGSKTHTLMVKVAGVEATVMVASTPTPAGQWFDGLARAITGLPEDKRDKAAAAVSKARGLTPTAEQDADKAAAAAAKPASESTTSTAPGDNLAEKVTADERAIATAMGEMPDLAVRVDKPVQMNTKGHQLHVSEKNGKLVVELESRRALLNDLVTGAITAEEAGAKRDALLKQLAAVNVKLQELMEFEAADEYSLMPFDHIVKWTAFIAAMLVEIGADFKVDDLENLGHPSIYVEGKQLKEDYRANVRSIFYPSGYRSSTDTWCEKVLATLLDPADPSRFIDQMTGKSEPRSIRGGYNDNVTIDHKTKVVDHWNAIGNNTRQPARLDFYNETAEMQLVSWKNNSTDGAAAAAAGARFQPEVGPDFRGPRDKD